MTTKSHDDIRTQHLNIDRRSFIALLSSLAASYPLASLASQREHSNSRITPESLAEPWSTLAAVQQHLLPAEDHSPGAADIHALTYLQNMMAAPDIDSEEKNFIKQGAGWLNDMAQKHKAADFARLNATDREQVLRNIEQSRAGERWLSLMLSYLIEALLSDPVYGGNPEGIGWKWLQHQPGFPTPTTEKMYYKLARSHTFKRTRA